MNIEGVIWDNEDTLDTAARLENVSDSVKQFARSIYKQESGEGRNTKTSNAGAIGGMQILPDTFNSVADKGWDINNPIHNARAGLRYAQQAYNAANGHISTAAAAYYAGIGRIPEIASGKTYRDKRNLKAPDTKEYGQSVASRLPAIDISNVVWDDSVDKAKSQLKSFEENYIRDNLSGLPQVAAEVKQMPWLNKAAIAAGKATSGFQYGIKDLGNFLADMLGDKDALNRSVELSKSRDEENRLYKPFEEIAGILAPAIGGSLPYLVPTPINPLIKKGGQAIVDSLSLPFSAARIGAQKGSVTLANKLANRPDLISRAVGNQLQKDLITPAQLNKTARLNRPKLKDPYYEDFIPSTIGSTVQGGLEGGLNYDDSVVSGALSSGIGTVGGMKLRKLTNRVPDYRQPPERDVLDWYKQQGGQPSHGLDTGSRRLQNFESQLEKSSSTSDAAALYKQENQLVDNKIAYKAMGIEDAENKLLTREELSKHMEDLQNGYTELAKGTVAKFDHNDLNKLNLTINNALSSPSKNYKNAANEAQKYVDAINANLKTIRDPLTGRIKTHNSLNGDAFINLQSQIKNDISTAYNAGNVPKAKVLEEIKHVLDEAIEKGVEQGKSSSTLEQYKDLNNKYAMTHLVLEHGYTPSGVDARKLHTYFSQSDAIRYYTGKNSNPQIEQLHKLGQVGFLRSKQDTSFAGVHNKGGNTLTGSLLAIPGSGMLPGFERLALSMYKKGIPARYGLLGMGPDNKFKLGDIQWSMPNFWRGPEVYTRALGQSTKPLPTLIQYLESAKDEFDKRVN